MEAKRSQIFRIIDANLNRIGEGLRVLEDLARLLLGDAELSQKLKTMRHEMARGDWSLQQQLLQSRDAEGDVGADLKAPDEDRQRELSETVVANARRVQEALRVVEELSKTADINLDAEKYKQARFALYTIEKELLARLLCWDKASR